MRLNTRNTSVRKSPRPDFRFPCKQEFCNYEGNTIFATQFTFEKLAQYNQCSGVQEAYE